jgi:GDP-4-dehydro-6-deoxy-D-mannose reductase
VTPSRILVTGASGFVGQYLVAALRARWPQAVLFTGAFDVADPDAVEAAVRAAAPEGCVHLAAIASIPEARRDPGRSFAVNLGGSLNLAQAILHHAPECRLVFVGSAECYGASFLSGTALDETAALAPLNVYAASKAAADLALGALSAEAGLRVLRFRPFNHTGPGQAADFVIPAFASQVARIEAGGQEAVIAVGDLTAHRDFLDVRDVVGAYVLGLENFDAMPRGTVFNLASGISRRIGDMMEALTAASGKAISVRTDPARLRPADIPFARGDAGAARSALGWTPQIPFQTTLQAVLEFERARVKHAGLKP